MVIHFIKKKLIINVNNLVLLYLFHLCLFNHQYLLIIVFIIMVIIKFKLYIKIMEVIFMVINDLKQLLYFLVVVIQSIIKFN